jgi:hypothetical protein
MLRAKTLKNIFQYPQERDPFLSNGKKLDFESG